MPTHIEATPKRAGPYRDGLAKRAANYAPLSPVSFLPKAAAVHPHRIALVHGAWRSTWAETYSRCRRLASALARRGVGPGDTVAVLAPNVPAMYEAHFGVPMTGAVLHTLNMRLDAEAIAFQLTHGEAKVFIADREFSAVAKRALTMLEHRILVIDIDDPLHQGGALPSVPITMRQRPVGSLPLRAEVTPSHGYADHPLRKDSCRLWRRDGGRPKADDCCGARGGVA